MTANSTPVPGQPAVIYDLTDYIDILKPFGDLLLEDNGQKYILRYENERNKLNIWDIENPIFKTVEMIIETVVRDFLNTTHPRFKGKGSNYFLEKDSWLNDKTSWQGQRIHRHIEPFLEPDEIGDVTSVFYFHHDDTINETNGCLEFYEQIPGDPLTPVWLPENLTPQYVYAPKKYSMVVMASEVWHRAKPYTDMRYSLATDVRAFTEEEYTKL